MSVKKFIILIFSLTLYFQLFAQSADFEATWKGSIGVNGLPLKLVLHLQKNVDGTYRGSMDSPDQGAAGIPVSKIAVNGNAITVFVKTVRGSFSGVLAPHGQSIQGTWKQGGAQYDLIFDRFPLEADQMLQNEITDQQAETLRGDWKGTLRTSAGTELLLIFHFTGKHAAEFEGTVDSPYQGAKGLPISRILVNDSAVELALSSLQARFRGRLGDDGKSIRGLWMQGGAQLPLRLTRAQEDDAMKRPQTPKPPFPYTSVDVKFKNEKAAITLDGTLTVPNRDGPFTTVVLVSGSGPQDRDEMIFGHKPFFVLADYLTRAGFAVLRYDDRGNGKSGGNFQTATTEDFAGDATAAVEYLKNNGIYKTGKVGIIGHSEGALIATMLAERGNLIDFMIWLGGPAMRGDSLLVLQNKALLAKRGMKGKALESALQLSARAFRIARMPVKADAAAKQIESLEDVYWNAMDEETETEFKRFGMGKGFMKKQIPVLLSPWFRFFLNYDPRPALKKINFPVLALYGEKDLQVPAAENVASLGKLQKNGYLTNLETKTFSGLNHLFQPADSGLPTEYARIETTIDKKALENISIWLKGL